MGCNANIRIYRYCVGQRFGKHIDESVEDENGCVSNWTVLIYLNGGTAEGLPQAGGGAGGSSGEGEEALRGGETVFYKVRWLFIRVCKRFIRVCKRIYRLPESRMQWVSCVYECVSQRQRRIAIRDLA